MQRIQKYIITCNCEECISCNCRSQKSTSIAAKWPNVSVIDTQDEAPIQIRQVISFIKHDIVLSLNTSTTTYSGYIQLYGDHLLYFVLLYLIMSHVQV